MKVKSETEGKNETEIESESAQFLVLNFLKLLYFRTYLKQKPYVGKNVHNFFNGFENLVKFWVGVHRMQNYNLCKTILGLSSKT